MPKLKFVKPERIWMKGNLDFTEKWVQARIVEDPALLGLGDVVIKDIERRQTHSGRLDLLLQDVESTQRYEVELQLGSSDESHIVRTLEYWDEEKRKYPQYEHCGVLVAEDITTRFLNVIRLFNGSVPVMAIQMSAFRVRESVTLLFTRVLDELRLGTDEEDEASAVTDRAYWEARGTKETVALADDTLKLIRGFASEIQLKYNKFYIGLAENDQPNNFVLFRAKKKHIILEIKLRESKDVQKALDATDLDVMGYDKRWGHYRIRLTKKDIAKNRDVLTKLMKAAWERASE